jgi:hypothetical protein
MEQRINILISAKIVLAGCTEISTRSKVVCEIASADSTKRWCMMTAQLSGIKLLFCSRGSSARILTISNGPPEVKCNTRLISQHTGDVREFGGVNSPSSEGNFLEALNLALMKFEKVCVK